MSTPFTILLFLGVLSFLVFVHEWGHFWVARKAKVKVEEFGIGFPPRLFSWVRGETVYSINAIPLGGFVRLFGESGEGKGEPGSFASASRTARALILVAGVVMNALTAIVLFGLSAWVGARAIVPEAGFSGAVRANDFATEIVAVLPDAPAAEAGIRAGDRVVSIGHQAEGITPEDARQIFQTHIDVPVFLNLLRDGESVSVSVTPRMLTVPDAAPVAGIGVHLVNTAHVSYPWYIAPVEGVKRTAVTSWAIIDSFAGVIKKLVVGESVGETLSGPVGIAVFTGQAAARGIGVLLEFTALLSLNLAILNLLPIPALDGGRLLFLAVEAVRRKTLPEVWEQRLHQVAFLFLISLILFVTYADILRLLRS